MKVDPGEIAFRPSREEEKQRRENTILLVAGLSLKNLKPRVWDVNSPYYLSHVQAVMVSYADFHRMPGHRRGAMEQGLHAYLGIPERIKVFLDNGAFYFLGHGDGAPKEAYEDFVAQARPDWWPIPQDFIPMPNMTVEEQRRCFTRTMEMNVAYQHDGYVPVIHISQVSSNLLRFTQEGPEVVRGTM